MVSIICANCGKQYEARRSDSKTCSPKCRKQLNRGSFPTIICEICGKEFKARAGSLYCSDSCAEYAVELQTYRKNSNRYDYIDNTVLGDEEDFIP
jgi:hypothetical protein